MTARPQAQCTPSCARYRSPFSPDNTTGLTKPFCAAFPDGIPDDIWGNRFDHRQPHEGDHGLQWTAKPGYEFPASAFGPGILGDVDHTTLTAAADIANGAMIALVPTETDAARLAVEGGEPVEQLHVTLLFLGDADTIPEQQRAALRSWADGFGNGMGGWDTVEAQAFAPAIFNPTGEEPCAVLVLSGDDLAEFYETVVAEVGEWFDLPTDRHQPWIPHITLGYTSAEQIVDPDVQDPFFDAARARTGPVTFDRLRVAIGGAVHDVPIGASWTPAATESGVAEGVDEPGPVAAVLTSGAVSAELVVAAVAVEQRETFDGCLRCFGPAHDGACPPAL